MKNNYIAWYIEGRTGEHSDMRHWSVATFLSKSEANTFRGNLRRRYNSEIRKAKLGGWEPLARHPALEKRMRELDPKFEMDYTGTEYHIIAIPILETFGGVLRFVKQVEADKEQQRIANHWTEGKPKVLGEDY